MSDKIRSDLRETDSDKIRSDLRETDSDKMRSDLRETDSDKIRSDLRETDSDPLKLFWYEDHKFSIWHLYQSIVTLKDSLILKHY